jgi:hypothetical protein
VILLFLAIIISCKKELEPQESSGIKISTTNGDNTNPTQNLPATQQNTNALAGLNPPHGQAGHRCDIAVGAPLNSVPNKTISSSSPTLTNSASNAKATPIVTKSGMNPPHGQAGHRCDIAVGAPLNSAPNKTKPSSSPTLTNSVSNSKSTPVVTKPGMNPPHGQTGHRCDIAVGAPLDSPSSKATPTPATTNSEPNNSPVPAILNPDTTTTIPKQ